MAVAQLLVALAATGGLKVGDPAPDFTAVSHTGSAVSLKDYAGRKLILWFYPRASTGG
jgi:peroxiredoxin Q/BCP